ncbi:MAG: 3-hydroxyacyl-CoA dehydrogenase NAD-binding domain-containing protein, partial [Pseudomonadota bacterium]
MRAPSEDGYTVGVIGAGAMGQGIAQVAIQGGLRTFLYDSSTDAAAAAKSTIFGRLQRSVEKGRLTTDEAHAAIERLEVVAAISSLSPCDAVIEAIVENLEIKRAVFRDVESVVGPDCLLASNTSSIPIAAIAQGCQERYRIGGMHFFNPVPVMRLVEVIRAAETSDLAVERMTELGKAFGRTPVAVQDSPGFLVNMGGRAYTTEAMRVASSPTGAARIGRVPSSGLTFS